MYEVFMRKNDTSQLQNYYITVREKCFFNGAFRKFQVIQIKHLQLCCDKSLKNEETDSCPVPKDLYELKRIDIVWVH